MFDGLNWIHLGIVLVWLHLFGWVYNALVNWAEKRLGPNHPWVADEVVVGNLVVLLSLLPVLGLESVLIIFVAFAAAGLPMWYGERVRFARRVQERDQEMGRHIEQVLGRTYDQ